MDGVIPSAKFNLQNLNTSDNQIQTQYPIQQINSFPQPDKIDLSNKEKKYKNPSSLSKIGGITAGTILGTSIKKGPSFINKFFYRNFLKNCTVTAQEALQAENAVKAMMKNSKLKDNGVEIVKVSDKNIESIYDEIAQNFLNKCKKWRIPQNDSIEKGIKIGIKNKIEPMFSMIKQGRNACYLLSNKKIYIPENKLELSVFHEAGHAINHNLSKVCSFLQKCGSIKSLTIPIAITALLKTKKAPDEKPQGTFDKITTFIKDNAGKLSFATFLPTLIEEGMASIRGNKFAKELLSPNLAKKYKTSMGWAWLTYLLSATFASLGVFAATKVKDIIAKKEVVSENKNQTEKDFS
ncbi:hypothetical protein IJG72_07760 [bacterium]|nr:hypothetical protein [bacterium]